MKRLGLGVIIGTYVGYSLFRGSGSKSAKKGLLLVHFSTQNGLATLLVEKVYYNKVIKDLPPEMVVAVTYEEMSTGDDKIYILNTVREIV